MATRARWAWVLLASAVTLLASCGGSAPPKPSLRPPPHPSPQSASRLFAADSVWNASLADNAPLDPRSASLAGWLDQQVSREFSGGASPYIQTVTDSTPVYRVRADQPVVRVTLDNDQSWARSLATALQAVPIPSGARPAAGSDAHLTIYQPSTDRLWELWKARLTPDGWHAAWGGAMGHVSSSPGYFSRQSWPGAKTYWGSTATSLPMVAGTMMINELKVGTIDHALAIALPAARAGQYASPAERTDGTDTNPDSIPEGAHLRLDPHLNVASLHLPRVIEMMALAAQRYGMIVRDKTGSAVAFFAEDPTATGTNPYTAIFGGIPSYDLLKYFPWAHLELLRMDLHYGTGSP
jgi:hypothetical protein